MNKLIILALASLSLMGCATKEVKPERSDIDRMIDSRVMSTHDNVQSIYGSSVYEKKPVASNTVNNINPELIPFPLRALIDVKWYGEARIVLKDLADSMDGVVFAEVGIKPSVPLDVLLNEQKTKVLNVLENIGYQLPDNAVLNVVIDPFDKNSVRVQLEYDK